MTLTKVHFAIWHDYPDVFNHFEYYEKRNEKINAMLQEDKTTGIPEFFHLIVKRYFVDTESAIEWDKWMKENVPVSDDGKSFLDYTKIVDISHSDVYLESITSQ